MHIQLHFRGIGKMLSQVLVLMLVATVVSSKSIDESASFKETERVIGGQDAAVGDFPYTAALYHNGGFICTASILSTRTVLTAAHCVYLQSGIIGQKKFQPASSFYAIANVTKSSKTLRIEFKTLIGHPDYKDGQFDNDVAVFITTEAIPFSNEVGPVCIAKPDTDMYEYKNATAIGWGKTTIFRFNPFDTPDRLQYAELMIVNNLVCSMVNGIVDRNKLCAMGGPSLKDLGFIGVCNGDSGGPLVYRKQGISSTQGSVQIGIASYINGNIGCGKIAPAVYTRVSAQYDFIIKASGNDTEICSI